MLVTDGGKIIRLGMGDLRVIGRNTQGVRLIGLAGASGSSPSRGWRRRKSERWRGR